MTSINKLLEYHELLMNYEDTSIYEKFDLPTGYHFEFYKNDNNITFVVKGYGHGVGMSQTGADSMAKEGSTFEDIIHHFLKLSLVICL